MKRAVAIVAVVVALAFTAPSVAAPPQPGVVLPKVTIVCDGVSSGNVRLSTLGVGGRLSYATEAVISTSGDWFDLVPYTGAPSDGVTLVSAPDGRQWKKRVTSGGGGSGGNLSDGDHGDIVVSGSVLTVDAAAISNAKMRDSAANSVMGRSAASIGSPADIVAGTDGFVLRLSGGVVAFGQLTLAGVPDGLLTHAKFVTSGVSAGTYGSASAVSVCTFDAYGIASSCTSTTISVPSTAISDSTATGRALIQAASASAARSAIGSVIGTDTEAYDADLAAIAALTSAADQVPYSTAANTWAMATFTSAGRTWLAASSAAAETALLNPFVASGVGHLKGLVPDPGASSGTTRYLREDATWNQLAFTDLSGLLGCTQHPALSGDVSTSSGSCSTTVGANKVLDSMIRQGGATSVIGRSANTTGNVADVSATADGDVLWRNGTTLGFGKIGSLSITDGTVANADLANMANGAVKCRKTAGTGVPEDCSQSDVQTTILGGTTAGVNMLTAATAKAQAALWNARLPVDGTAIGDADTTVNVSGGSRYTMATVTAARVVTFGVSGSPVSGAEVMRVDVTRTSAFTVTFKDDAGTTLVVCPASVPCSVVVKHDGTSHFANPSLVRIQ